MKRLILTIRFGMSLSAALVAFTLTGCQAPAGDSGPHAMTGESVSVPDDPDALAEPSHTGPKQIDAYVDLSNSNKSICISKKSKVYVITAPKSGKKYLVIEGVPCDK